MPQLTIDIFDAESPAPFLRDRAAIFFSSTPEMTFVVLESYPFQYDIKGS